MDMFEFLSPEYLPSLDSLNITRIFLNSPTFLNPFLRIAPQLRYLFLAPLDQRHVNTFLQVPDYIVDSTLPTTLLAACISLKHLALIHAFSIHSEIPFDLYAPHLPANLQTLVLDFKEFNSLRTALPCSLPPNLSNLRDIILYPATNFYECYGELSGADWAKQFGVKWRLASEYSNWIDGEMSYDRAQYDMTQNEVNDMEVWNDLKDWLD